MGAKTKVGSESTPVASTQHDRFLDTARALGGDEDEAAFDEKLKAVVGSKKSGTSKRDSKAD